MKFDLIHHDHTLNILSSDNNKAVHGLAMWATFDIVQCRPFYPPDESFWHWSHVGHVWWSWFITYLNNQTSNVSSQGDTGFNLSIHPLEEASLF